MRFSGAERVTSDAQRLFPTFFKAVATWRPLEEHGIWIWASLYCQQNLKRTIVKTDTGNNEWVKVTLKKRTMECCCLFIHNISHTSGGYGFDTSKPFLRYGMRSITTETCLNMHECSLWRTKRTSLLPLEAWWWWEYWIFYVRSVEYFMEAFIPFLLSLYSSPSHHGHGSLATSPTQACWRCWVLLSKNICLLTFSTVSNLKQIF